jgi:dinuclear metal center YbgI/SA1388 family protein
MATVTEVTEYLDELLDITICPGDKSHNGLQVDAGAPVRHAVFAVDSSLELSRLAAAKSADFIFVHHGESWGNALVRLSGRVGDRIRFMMQNGMSLYAAHLPLDAHPTLGHNACIADALNLGNRQSFGEYCGTEIGVYGELAEPVSSAELAQRLNLALDTESRVLDFSNDPVRTVGVISGAGADALTECAQKGIDCLVTGECNHTHYHVVQELNTRLILGGHYKTEVPGVLAVMDKLRSRFDITAEFIDIPTGF